MEYVLTLILVNGQQRELLLDKPHVLVPSPNDPKAVSWTDRDGLIHNVPWSSIIELYFSPEDFNACRLASLEQNKQLKEIK